MPSLESGWLLPDWPVPTGVRAVVTTRRSPGHSAAPYEQCNLGLNSGEDAATVHANRAGLERALGLPSAPRWLRQVHGREVFDADRAAPADEAPAADAARSARRGTVLAVLTADCLPVLFAAADGSEVAVAHAGWRGLAGGVLEATLAGLRTPPSRLLAWLGPCIGQPSYEVDEAVRSAFVDDSAQARTCFADSRPGHWFCDLAGLARQRLAAAGVAGVHGGGFDTRSDPRFYSFRRDGARSGRFASLIWLA